MKNLVMITVAALSMCSAVSQAAMLTCKVQKNYTVMMPDLLVATCDSEGYKLKIEGIGLGLQGALWTGLAVSCPGVDDPSGRWVGVKIDYDVLIGNDLGLYYSPTKKAFCAIGTINAGSLGTAASYSNLTIVRK